MPSYNDIFDYIKRQESDFKHDIQLNDVWQWNFRKHVMTSELYVNSQLYNGKNDFTPVKNITKPILNLQHRAEDIEVKDVQIYVDDAELYHLSFLVKKYHDDVFVREYDIDQFFDELNISRIDFGGGLSKQLAHPCPEVVPLQSIAFCDQTDMLSGPIGIKHYYSPDQLLAMADKGWGKMSNGATISLEDLIKVSRDEKKDKRDGMSTKTPGRYIEVYEVHGNLPKRFTDPSGYAPADMDEKYQTAIFIVAFYQKRNGNSQQGVILYTKPEAESPFKLIKRDPVYGRALGFGGAEELFEPQVWVNYDMIRMQGMLDAASKTILTSTDPAFTQKNKITNMENLEVADLAPGTEVKQLDTLPRNLVIFEKSLEMWEQHAKDIGGAQDPLQGVEPTAGTPFASLAEQVRQGMALHEYRRQQYAKHLEEIYRDWIIPHIETEICKGKEFLSELSLEEVQFVSENIVINEVNRMIKEKILNGEIPDPQEVELYKQQVIKQLQKKGNKFFIKILKGEFKNTPLAVKVSVAGKSKNLAQAMDKLVNIFRFAFSNPQGFAQTMQIPGMAKAFNEIIEYAGLSQVDFSGIDKLAQPPPQQPQQQLPQGQPQPGAVPSPMQMQPANQVPQ